MALYTSDWAGLIRLIGKESWLLAVELGGQWLAAEVEEENRLAEVGDQSLGRVEEHNPAEVGQSLGEEEHLLHMGVAGLPFSYCLQFSAPLSTQVEISATINRMQRD